MKNVRFRLFLGVCSTVLCLQANGAIVGLNLTPLPNGSPAFSEFITPTLAGGYTYNSVTGVGTLTVTNSGGVTKQGEYTSSPESPGTHGAYTSASFNGFYTLTATIQDIGGQWEVTGGNFSVEGALLGGSTTSVLLTGNLRTGNNSFGYGTTKADDAFDLLFTTTGGSPSIVSDFFGAGTGNGGIYFQEGSATTYSGSLTSSWIFTSGDADTFVPEPIYYPFAAAGTAIFGLVLSTRKSVAQCLVFG